MNLKTRLSKIDRFIIGNSNNQAKESTEQLNSRKTLIIKLITPILETMRDDHKNHLLKDIDSYVYEDEWYRKVSRPFNLLHPFTRFALNEEKPLIYFGPECYEGYLKGAHPLSECIDCSWKFPFIRNGYTTPSKDGKLERIPSVNVLETCPRCKGKVEVMINV